MARLVTVDTTQLAKLIDVGPQYVRKLAGQGVLERARDETGNEIQGRWEMIKNNHAYIHHLRQLNRWDDTSEVRKASLTNRKLAADAEVAELRLAQIKGSLHRDDDVGFYVTSMIVRFKARVEAIPSRCGRLLVGVTDVRKIRRILTDELGTALKELSVPDSTTFNKLNEQFLEQQEAGEKLLAELDRGNNGQADAETEADR